MKKILQLLIALTLLVGMVAFPIPASACSCAMPGTPQQAIIQADAVFIGNVVGSGTNLFRNFQNFLAQYVPSIPYHFSGSRTFTFNVSQSWKGVTQNSVTLTTGFGDADCGYSFTLGTDYVVYAYHSGAELSTNICTRTAQVGYAAQDLAYLNTLPSLSLTNSYLAYITPLICTGVLAGSILFVFLFIRRRRKKLALSNDD